MRFFRRLVVLGLIVAGVLWVLARPDPMTEADIAGLGQDAVAGEAVFWAAGCASCHMAPKPRAMRDGFTGS